VGLLVGVAAVLAVAAFGGWWFFIRDDAPPEASIDDAAATLDDAGSGDAPAAEDGAPATFEGTWVVDSSIGSFDDFSGTFAGYRIQEEVATVGTSIAVGRTPQVTGTMTVTTDAVSAVDVEVDLTTLESDNNNRDRALASQGIEYEQFPTATFALTSPISLPAGLAEGRRVSTTATGDLTLHGVTNEVTLDVEAELRGDTAVVVGNAAVLLSDYSIDPPAGFSVLSIENEGTFEFQLFFTRQ
jgi:polyisoprenoid-binding protein YceI